MLPPSLAFAWLMWRRYHGVIIFTVAALVVIAVVAAVLPAYCGAEIARGIIGFLASLVPSLFMVFLIALTYAEGADVLARKSCFPIGLCRLPVRTAALAGWPIVYGAVFALFYWYTVSWFILRPIVSITGEEVPRWWPAMFCTMVVAWTQALMWTPFGLRGFRLVLVGVAAVLFFVVILWRGRRSAPASEEIAVVFALLTAVGWVAAYAGVRRARQGDEPSWDWLISPWLRLFRRATISVPFASAKQADAWFVWRMTGLGLPVMTCLVLPWTLMPLLFSNDNFAAQLIISDTVKRRLLAEVINNMFPTPLVVCSSLALPVIFAGMGGVWVGGSQRWVRDRAGMMAFLATLPLSNAIFVAGMLRSAARSTLVTWVLVASLAAGIVVLTGNVDALETWWLRGREEHSPLRIAVGVGAVFAWLVLWTWKRRVDGLHLGLSGREWVHRLIALVCFPTTMAIGITVACIYKTPSWQETALLLLPWLLGLVMLCRLLLTAWAVRHLVRQRLVDRLLIRWLAAWLVGGSLLLGLLAWTVPAEQLPFCYVVYGVLFAMPMARLAAAPLALAWNRHR